MPARCLPRLTLSLSLFLFPSAVRLLAPSFPERDSFRRYSAARLLSSKVVAPLTSASARASARASNSRTVFKPVACHEREKQKKRWFYVVTLSSRALLSRERFSRCRKRESSERILRRRILRASVPRVYARLLLAGRSARFVDAQHDHRNCRCRHGGIEDRLCVTRLFLTAGTAGRWFDIVLAEP